MAKRNLSHWEEIVKESANGSRIWVGIDVHKKTYAVAVLSDSGVRHYFTTPADYCSLFEQFSSRNIKITALTYEAGLTGFGLYRACRKAGINAMVVSANRIPRPATRTAKTDKIDCMKLAEYLALGLLKPIYVPDEDNEACRTIIRRRHQLAVELGNLKNRIKSFLILHDMAEPPGLEYWSRAGIASLFTLEMHPDLRFTFDSYLRQLQFLEGEKAVLEQEIKKVFSSKDDILQSVPGVGPFTAATFRAEIIAPDRFQNPEQLAGYLGLAPITSQSGQSSGSARIIPCGQGKLRSMLVEAAWVLKNREPWAIVFYERILRRNGKAQKAIIALARKLAVILWRLWQDNRFYQSEYI